MENSDRGRSSTDTFLKRELQDLLLIIVGLAMTFGSGFMPNADLFIFCFFFGATLAAVGLVLIVYHGKLLSDVEVPDSKHKNILKDTRGVAVIYAVCIMGIFVTIICWLPLAWAAYEIMDTMTSTFNYPAVAMGTVRLIQWVIAWTPAVIICGLLVYAIVSSFRTEYPSRPMG
jgi:hypothetical protein